MKNIQVTTVGIKRNLKQFNPYKSIAEFIWNGFDAKATCIHLTYEKDELDNIISLSIADNGSGIDRSTLDITFRIIYDSQKNKFTNLRKHTAEMHGENGIGRLSFFTFAQKACWQTVYAKNDQHQQYAISIVESQLDHYDVQPEITIPPTATGTVVTFSGIHSFNAADIETELKRFLAREFGWFLELNRENQFTIDINGEPLLYAQLVSDQENFEVFHAPTSTRFEVRYMRWHENLKEYSRYYCIDSYNRNKYKNTTLLNNKGDHFYHSLFIKSTFFDHFDPLDHTRPQDPLGYSTNSNSPAFVYLLEEVHRFIKNKRRPFLHEYAGRLIAEYEQQQVFPEINVKNEWEQFRSNLLKETIRGLYEVQPRIFAHLNHEQKKVFVRLLDLIMDAGEQARMLDILHHVVHLDSGEREKLAKLLKASRLSAVIKTIELVQDRYQAIHDLKRLVYERQLAAKEVPHIQNFIQNHFWIIGEQYHLITAAEPKFEEALRRWHLHVKGKDQAFTIDHPDKHKEMDIFMVRQDRRNGVITNVVLELKRPFQVRLGKAELDQVQTYYSVILSQDQFNDPGMQWEYYLIGNDFDASGYIEGQLENAKNHGEKSLVYKVRNHKIYVKKWSEIFSEFELRHEFLNQKLALERQQLISSASETADDIVTRAIANRAHQ